MVDRTDPLSPEAELDALLGRSEPTSAESHAPTSAPNFFEMPEPTAAPAPTPVPAADDSEPPSSQPLIDTAAWVSRLNKTSDEIEKGTSLRDGALGGFGVAAPGAETEAAIGAAEQQLTGPKFGPMDVFSNLPSVKDIAAGILGFGAQPTATTGNPVADIATRAGGATVEGIARNKIETDKRISEAIERAKKNPEFGITTPGVAGATRAAIDAGVQSMADIPASVVDSIGIGANIAGWAVSGGQQPIDQDNSARAVARWARAVSKSYFPSDPTRQEDFAVNLARGVGSTAGFWGVNSAALAARMAKPGAMWVTAAVGALANAPSSYEQAIQSRREGREVSDLALMFTFLGGAALGATEAMPVARNLPLPPGSKSQLVAYLQAILREGGEEGAQELFQAVGEDLWAKIWHDPNRRIGDEASLNSLVGFLSGGGLTAARLGLSRGARVEAIAQSRYGVERGDEVVARLSRGGRSGASQPPAAPAPAEPEAPNLPQQAPNLAPAPSARSTTIDLDQYADPGAGAYPAPTAPAPFDAGAQFSPSARIEGGAAAGGGMAAVTEPPSLSDLMKSPAFPRDETNDHDLRAFSDVLESATGKRYYHQLTPEEKFSVAQTFETGVLPASGEAAAVAGQTATRAGAAAATGGEQPASAPIARPKEEQRYIDRMRISGGPSTEGLSDDQLAEQYRTKWASRAQPTVQAAPQPTVGEAPAPSQEEQAAFAFRDAGANSEWLDRAMQIPPIAGNADLAGHEALQGDVELTFDVAQEDGTIDQETMVMPAVDALTMIDRRLKGIALLLGCVG